MADRGCKRCAVAHDLSLEPETLANRHDGDPVATNVAAQHDNVTSPDSLWPRHALGVHPLDLTKLNNEVLLFNNEVLLLRNRMTPEIEVYSIYTDSDLDSSQMPDELRSEWTKLSPAQKRKKYRAWLRQLKSNARVATRP